MRRQILSNRLRNLIKWPFYCLYEKRLTAKAHSWVLPKHIGIVLDGNRRYAKESGLDTVLDGHAKGADKLHDVLDWCFELNIRCVTIWIFSTENFRRKKTEVEGLMELFEERTRKLIDDPAVHKNQVRVRYIGQIDKLPDSLQDAISQAETATADYDNFTLNVAIAYGGQQEITDAFRAYLRDKIEAGADIETVLEEMEPEQVEPYLYTADVPDPDLIIRTSGEVRLSGFLLWQSAYAEYYFCDTYWPNFRRIDFLRAVRSFSTRQRRYGK